MRELALFEFRVPLMLTKLLQHMPDVLQMRGSILTKDQNIIQIHQNKVANFRLKSTVHGSLERGWGIYKPKRIRHHNVFIQPIRGEKRRFLLVPISDAQLMIRCTEVNSREIFRPGQLIQEVTDAWQGKLVQHRVLVEGPKVYAHA